ncbi:MAG: peptidoglycan-binding domain-containing protein [Terrimicrobiaceae bacterium]|nr:peptidoglycan-binding domain-containing protein [Terrimicrobiaceae bacterium]
MKIRLLLALLLTMLAAASTSQAGWGRGCGWGGPRLFGGFGWGGGYCAPAYGWGGYWGPAFGVTIAAPVVVYRSQPANYYARPVYEDRAFGQATLVRIQAQLARLGYYRGEVDGAFGPLTSSAIQRYQADYGLPVTGRLDRRTLVTLGV